ncbi:hypothetical protein GIB67_020953, partial [Kingdonia uniflora]
EIPTKLPYVRRRGHWKRERRIVFLCDPSMNISLVFLREPSMYIKELFDIMLMNDLYVIYSLNWGSDAEKEYWSALLRGSQDRHGGFKGNRGRGGRNYRGGRHGDGKFSRSRDNDSTRRPNKSQKVRAYLGPVPHLDLTSQVTFSDFANMRSCWPLDFACESFIFKSVIFS